MKRSTLDRALMAYRPLYLNGLLLDGQYRLPTKAAREDAPHRPAHRHRLTLLALTGLRHAFSSLRSPR